MTRENPIFPLDGVAFRDDIWRSLRHPSFMLGMMAAGVVFALLGPFGTFDRMEVPIRLLYWVVLCVGNGVLAVACLMLLSRRKLRYESAQDLILLVLLASLANGLPGSFLVAAANALLASQRSWQLVKLVELGLYVSLITLLLCSAFIAIGLLRRNAGPLSADRFDLRIPPLLGGELLALSSEDHYLRVYTSTGDALIHCPLATAMQELSRRRGRQVHRSHWVAAEAVVAAVHSNGRWQLTLRNGISIPVSRAKVGELKAAGWLKKRA